MTNIDKLQEIVFDKVFFSVHTQTDAHIHNPSDRLLDSNIVSQTVDQIYDYLLDKVWDQVPDQLARLIIGQLQEEFE